MIKAGMMPSATAAVAIAAAAGGAAQAQDLTDLTLLQAHARVGVGEDVFLYVVPQYLDFFEEEGLNVRVEGVRGGTLAAQVLQSGDADVASTAPEIIMSVREKGGDIKSFFTLRRQGGYAIAVPADSEIETIEDLEGAVIGAASLASGAVPIVNGMMGDIGLSDTDYTIVASGTGGQAASAISTGQVDALALWDAMYAVIENQGVEMRYLEIPVIPKLAGLTLAASDSFLEEDREVAEGFCRAVAKGWVFAETNPRAAVEMLYELYPETKPTDMTEEAIAGDVNILTTWMANGTGSDPDVPLGWNYPEKWEFTYQYYQETDRLAEPEPLENHYTNDLIEACNDFDRQAIVDLANSM